PQRELSAWLEPSEDGRLLEGLLEKPNVLIDDGQPVVRLCEIRIEAYGTVVVAHGPLVRIVVEPSPGQLAARHVGFRQIRVQRERLLDLDQGLFLPLLPGVSPEES